MKKLIKKELLISKNDVVLDWQNSVTDTVVQIAPGASLAYVLIAGLGNTQKRHIRFELSKGSQLTVRGITFGSNSENLDISVDMIHQDPNTSAYTELKGVFLDSATGKLNGTIIIAEGAQKTDSQLDERILLLSGKARAEAVPNLEIEADDVTASHAATVSRISDNEIFYLQSRGLSKTESLGLIIGSFLRSPLELLPEGDERATLEEAIQNKLSSVTYESIS